MPNQPSAEKDVISFRVSRELKAKVVKASRCARIANHSDYVRKLLQEATKEIVLTDEEKVRIREEVQRKKDGEDFRRTRRRRAGKARRSGAA